MGSPPGKIDRETFETEATELLDGIVDLRDELKGIPGVLDGELGRFRDRVDRLIRESEVDNWRQVRIFLRDVDAIAADLSKAASDKRLAPKQVFVLDLALRKARKRDFYGARKAWRKLDRIAERSAELRRLEARYRERYRGLEARIRSLRAEADRLGKVPKPPASVTDASTLIKDVEEFVLGAEVAYLDFLSRTRAETALPLLLETGQGGGVGVPAPPSGCDPEPLLGLLTDSDPARQDLRERSFYGLLELPSYSDAKLSHMMGDARVVRRALDAAWPWLKAIRDEERRSLRVQWTEDAVVLQRRVSGIVSLLRRLGASEESIARGEALLASLASGRFGDLQRASRLYATYGTDAERRWRGELEGAVEALVKEAGLLSAKLKRFPEPARLETATNR